ncbi:MAG: hypothetical protein Q7T16_04590 [Candidatus Burarchaeum sp.]|nr:hypothetical protein [Candidatus Burarchaeum sp.]MDO8339906.1 hypothetical protein [Candidatus Burarchaeum sp.]
MTVQAAVRPVSAPPHGKVWVYRRYGEYEFGLGRSSDEKNQHFNIAYALRAAHEQGARLVPSKNLDPFLHPKRLLEGEAEARGDEKFGRKYYSGILVAYNARDRLI